MFSHDGPRNGDYASHIDQLVNQGARSPGQTLKSAATTRPKRKLRRSDDEPAPATLAEASKLRFVGLVRYVIAAIFLLNAVRALSGALHRHDGPGALVGLIFVLVIASLMLRWARAARRRGKQALKPLPPLTSQGHHAEQ